MRFCHRFSGLIIFCVSLFFGVASVQASTVFLFGGGPRPQPALQQFVEKIQGPVLVITWATQEPDEVFEAIAEDLKKAGAQEVIPAPHDIQTASDRSLFLEALENSSGVFFSGGDQNLALDVIEQNNLRGALQAAFKKGHVFAGTSAGTALMPRQAMRGGDAHSLPAVRPGLGLVEYFVDQHFIVRGREPRLRKLVQQGQRWGVGVDEGMCAKVEGQKLTALGPTEVQIFIPQKNGTIDKVRLRNEDHITMPAR